MSTARSNGRDPSMFALVIDIARCACHRHVTASRYRGIHTCRSLRCHSKSSSGFHPERDIEEDLDTTPTTSNSVQARIKRRPALIRALRQNPEISDEQDAAQELDWIEQETPRQATRGGWEGRVDDRVKRRGEGEPLQYILGQSFRLLCLVLARAVWVSMATSLIYVRIGPFKNRRIDAFRAPRPRLPSSDAHPSTRDCRYLLSSGHHREKRAGKGDRWEGEDAFKGAGFVYGVGVRGALVGA